MSQSTAALHSPTRSRGRGAFVRQFIMNTGMIGAIAPSSRYLAAEMIRGLDLGHSNAVLEYGPGSGVFTDAILPRLGKHTKFLPIELNDDMAAAFEKRHPRVKLIHDSVEHARRICDEHGIDQVDYIISGLPWASFPESLQVRILDGVTKVLKPGGTLVTFGYHVGTLMPAGKRFARLFRQYFATTSRTPVIWRNIPPAFVVRGTR